MQLDEPRLKQSIEEAVSNAIRRLHVVDGLNRWAVISEYKEWLVESTIQDEVWCLKYIRENTVDWQREGIQIKTESQQQADRIQNEALTFRQQTQQQCEALIQQSRNEAAFIQEGANKYAEQTLMELEKRLQELSQVVLSGRNE